MSAHTQPEYAEMGVTVLTSSFQIRGKLRIFGIMGTFLNDEQKSTLTVYDAEMVQIEANSRIKVNKDEVFIYKSAAQVIAFDAMPPQGALSLLPKAEPLAMYLDHFALSAKFYMGQDARLGDFAGASLQQFLFATDLKFYPTFQARTGLVQAAPMGIVHKSAIRFYHRP